MTWLMHCAALRYITWSCNNVKDTIAKPAMKYQDSNEESGLLGSITTIYSTQTLSSKFHWSSAALLSPISC